LNSKIHENQILKNLRLKLWVTETPFKSVLFRLIMILQLITIVGIKFRKFRISLYLQKGYGLVNFAVMFKLTRDQLEERLYMDYRDIVNNDNRKNYSF
jgi:hypothetical protein